MSFNTLTISGEYSQSHCILQYSESGESKNRSSRVGPGSGSQRPGNLWILFTIVPAFPYYVAAYSDYLGRFLNIPMPRWKLREVKWEPWNGHVCSVAKLYLTLCNSMDSSLPGCSVHGISQAPVLEWVAISSSRRSSQSRGGTWISCIGRKILYHWASWEAKSKYSFHCLRWFQRITKLGSLCPALLYSSLEASAPGEGYTWSGSLPHGGEL